MANLHTGVFLALGLSASLVMSDDVFWDNSLSDDGLSSAGSRRVHGNAEGLKTFGSPIIAGGAAKMEYRQAPDCPGNTAEGGDADCQSARMMCAREPDSLGVMTRVYSRPADSNESWTLVGRSCFPNTLMKPSRPDLTLADVQAEFARTPFASPGGSMQPVGQRSLVRLPVFFAASWSAQGYRPGQVRSVSLLGRAVDFRIALDHFIYDFGDGHSSGATRSMGGAYPSGDIRHSYTRVGSFTPVLTAVLTADFRVDGGAWQPIGGTATRRGSFPPVTVHSASNRLVP